MQQYELFTINKKESINKFTRFTLITNDLCSLGKTYTSEYLVRKVLRSLTNHWLPRITAIQEAKDLKRLSLEQLIGSLMTHELVLDSKTNELKIKGTILRTELESEIMIVMMMLIFLLGDLYFSQKVQKQQS